MIEYLKIVEERKINMKFLDAEFAVATDASYSGFFYNG